MNKVTNNSASQAQQSGSRNMTRDQDSALPSLQNDADTQDQHSIPETVLYHLGPGVLIVAVFAAAMWLLAGYDLPPSLIFYSTVLVTLIPSQLGLMLYLGWRRNGRLSLDGIVAYREPLPLKSYLWMTPLLFVVTVAIFLAISTFSEPIYRLFEWWPTMLRLDLDIAAHSKGMLLLTWSTILVLGGVLAPAVEELYFRGFLLPRLSRFGVWAPVIESTLFALYHLWSPWQLVERAVAWLPVTYVTQYKRNAYLAVVVHCAINSLLSLPLLASILVL